MELQNGYKVIYDATAADKKHHLHATKTDASAGTQVSYKTGSGTTIDPSTVKLVYQKDNSLYYSTTAMPSASDEKILVYVGADLILGEAPVVTPKVITEDDE